MELPGSCQTKQLGSCQTKLQQQTNHQPRESRLGCTKGLSDCTFQVGSSDCMPGSSDCMPDSSDCMPGSLRCTGGCEEDCTKDSSDCTKGSSDCMPGSLRCTEDCEEGSSDCQSSGSHAENQQTTEQTFWRSGGVASWQRTLAVRPLGVSQTSWLALRGAFHPLRS